LSSHWLSWLGRLGPSSPTLTGRPSQVLVLITLLERVRASLITRLLAVANVVLPAPVV
jgi:hypothetical protein